MSKIVEKAFDATKKIIRSIFLGSPNLITSSDLNRQLSAIKYQLDQLDDKTGMIIERGTLIHYLSGGTLSVSLAFSSIKFKGCEFKPSMDEILTINMTSSAPIVYLCLAADTAEITYSDDSTHEIAGAKFVDGTSYPAANQLVYQNEKLLLTHALSSVDNVVGVIAVFTLSSTGNVVIKENFITNSQEDNLSMGKSGVITDFDPTLKGTIGNGTSYDRAFSILANRFANVVPDWTSFSVPDGSGASMASSIKFRIKDGAFYLNIPAFTYSKLLSRMESYIGVIAEFPASVKEKVVSYFRELSFPHNNTFTSMENYIVFGDLGEGVISTPLESSTTGTDDEAETTITSYPGYGTVKLCLLFSYTGDVLSGVSLGCYISNYIRYYGTFDKFQMYPTPPISWLATSITGRSVSGTVSFPRMFTVLPLIGK